MLQAALNADSKVGLKLNIEKLKLNEVIEVMPALRRPTVSSLADDSWVAQQLLRKKFQGTYSCIEKNGSGGDCGISLE